MGESKYNLYDDIYGIYLFLICVHIRISFRDLLLLPLSFGYLLLFWDFFMIHIYYGHEQVKVGDK